MKPEDIFPNQTAEKFEAWLQNTNERYRATQTPIRRRPLQALSDLSVQFNCAVSMVSPLAERVFKWFAAHSPPGAHTIGAMFTGVFLFDTAFWPVDIPVGYGQFRVSPLDSLTTMPAPVRESLWQSAEARPVFLSTWVDCFDYAYGADVLLRDGTLGERAKKFLENADAELRGASAALLTHRPTLKASIGFRMACEIYLKVFLLEERKLSDSELRALGHRIHALAAACYAVKPHKEFRILEQGASAFPEVSARYDGTSGDPKEVFDAVFLTQQTAATVVRHFSSQDSRSQIPGFK